MLMPVFRIGVYACIFAPLVLGTTLLIWSFRRRGTQSVELPPKQHDRGSRDELPPRM